MQGLFRWWFEGIIHTKCEPRIPRQVGQRLGGTVEKNIHLREERRRENSPVQGLPVFKHLGLGVLFLGQSFMDFLV
jgi:hypothetical protein